MGYFFGGFAGALALLLVVDSKQSKDSRLPAKVSG